jgi:hypothetical protein
LTKIEHGGPLLAIDDSRNISIPYRGRNCENEP